MGTVKQLKNGKYSVSVYDTNGKRFRSWFDERKYAGHLSTRLKMRNQN